VGLAVHLDEDPDATAAVHVRFDDTLARLAPGPLRGLGQALLAQDLHGALHLAIRLLQRSLAVHYARAAPFAELLHAVGGEIDPITPFDCVHGKSVGTKRRRRAWTLRDLTTSTATPSPLRARRSLEKRARG